MEHYLLSVCPEFDQAVGMLSIQLETTVEDAELRLLAEADRLGVPVEDLAEEVTSRMRRFYS